NQVDWEAPMIHLDDLPEIAEELQRLGMDVTHEIIYGPRGYQEGLDVGEEFFPLWELNLPENQEDFERRDFAPILARRGPNWSVAAPLHVEVRAAAANVTSSARRSNSG